MKSSRIASIAALAGVFLAIAASGPGSAAQPFTIDVLLPMTGSLAYDGSSNAETLRVFEQWTNEHGGLRGRPIHFEIHDDQSNPAVSVQLLAQIIAQHAAVVLGSSSAGTCRALMPLAKDGPVLYCFSPAIQPPKGGYVFATSIPVDPYINAMIRYLRLRGFRRLAIISSTDGSGAADDESTRRVLTLPENADLKIVDWEHFSPGDLTVNAQAARIKSSDAQAIVAWTSGTPFGTVLRSLHDVGIELPVETTQANGDVRQLKQYLAFFPKQLVMPGYAYALPMNLLPSPKMRRPIADFETAYREAHAILSFSKSGTVWDPAAIVLSGFRKLGPQANAEQLRDYILGLRDFAGIDGMYDFSSGDQHGLTDKAVVLVTWDPAADAWQAVSGPSGIPHPK